MYEKIQGVLETVLLKGKREDQRVEKEIEIDKNQVDKCQGRDKGVGGWVGQHFREGKGRKDVRRGALASA